MSQRTSSSRAGQLAGPGGRMSGVRLAISHSDHRRTGPGRIRRRSPKCPSNWKSLPRKKLPWRIRRPWLSRDPRPIGGTPGFLPGHGRRRSRSAKRPGPSEGPGGAILDLPSGPDGAVSAVHPLAALFIELWAARGEGSRVEVHLESGSVLLPDGYLKSHSQQDYAVLVTRDPDGCSTHYRRALEFDLEDHPAGGQASAGGSGAVTGYAASIR